MSQKFEGERMLMRIFIGEADKVPAGPMKGQRLSEALPRLFKERGFAGCTVLHGVKGFGASAHVRSADILRLSLDLPVIIEVVETDENIQQLRPELEAMIGSGLITLEKVHVILYRPGA
jgi:PII-like signaling protein